MAHFNKIILEGIVHEDPVDNNGVVKFTLINEDGYGDKKKTNWFKVVCFRKTAEFVAKYVKNRSSILLDGSVQIREYEGKYYTEVIANSVKFIGSMKKDDSPKRDLGGYDY